MKKRILKIVAFVISLVAIVGAISLSAFAAGSDTQSTEISDAPVALAGDINADGVVDTRDAIILFRYVSVNVTRIYPSLALIRGKTVFFSEKHTLSPFIFI